MMVSEVRCADVELVVAAVAVETVATTTEVVASATEVVKAATEVVEAATEVVEGNGALCSVPGDLQAKVAAQFTQVCARVSLLQL
ncbi:unnamed protein product [Closterium sp. NIES-54]